jgi:peptidoglycan lytic transglycosylase G
VSERTPEERRRAAEERAARRAARSGDGSRSAGPLEPTPAAGDPEDPALRPADPDALLPADPYDRAGNGGGHYDDGAYGDPDDAGAEDELEPLRSPRRGVVAADRPPMSRAARAQRIGRPGRPALPPTAPKPRRWFRRLIAVLALALIGAALWFINQTFQPFKGHDEQAGAVAVQIPPGADAGSIGRLLQSKGVIDDARFFEINATLTLRRGKLITGRYLLRRNMTNGAAIEALMQGPKVRVVKTFDVTIPEGLSRREAAPIVAKEGVDGSYLKASAAPAAVKAARKLGAPKGAKTEGFLFPATYELKAGARAPALVAKQLDAFKSNFGSINLRRARSRNLTAYDVVIIASMIERETACDDERPLIASVIYNRLRDGIPLGIDATIRYAENNWTRPLRQSELERDGPYNTRLRQGLPPTPIGNPGMASLKAAARPANTKYLFYVAKPGASHAFSRTEAQFERDVAAYNKAREENGGKAPAQKC